MLFQDNMLYIAILGCQLGACCRLGLVSRELTHFLRWVTKNHVPEAEKAVSKVIRRLSQDQEGQPDFGQLHPGTRSHGHLSNGQAAMLDQ